MITQEELKKLLHYDPETGIFTWLKTAARRLKIGQIAGSIRKDKDGKSYTLISVNNKRYLAHRLSWLYTHGEFPDEEIDHISGDGIDNRLCNLRSVSRSENCKNMRRNSKNKSGITGVIWRKDASKWAVQISSGRKKINLGLFNNIFDAACARKNAEIKYEFHKNHGSNRPL